MLGVFKDFPVFANATADFTWSTHFGVLQEAVFKTANDLNGQEFDLKVIMPTEVSCRIGFEFGVAEDASFNYLDSEEIERFRKILSKSEFLPCVDFLCIIKYYAINGDKRQPLRFDNYLLRFIFQKPLVHLRVFHEKGTQRLPIEELIKFLTRRISAELERTQAPPLRLRSLMHPVPIEKL